MRLLQNTMERPVSGLSFGPAGLTLVAGGSGGYDVWRLARTSNTFIPSHATKDVYGCVCDPLGRWLYVSDYVGGFRLLALGDKEPPPIPGSADERHVTSFDITSNGGQLVMSRGGASLNRLECWKVRANGAFTAQWSLCDGESIDPAEPYLFNQAKWFTNGVAVSRDGKLLVTAESRSSASGDRPLIVSRRGASGKLVAELGRSATGFAARLAIASHGKAAYVWDKSMVERWDLKTGKCTSTLAAPGRGYFSGLAVHPAGRIVITASGDGQVRFADAIDLSVIREIKCGIGKLHAIALSQDGALIAAGGAKGQIAIWDTEL